MDSKNNYNLVMISPIPRDYIYKTSTVEKAGRKALEYLSKNFNINQSKIILQDVNTKNEYSFMAIKNNIQKGGANANFINKVSEISRTIDESVESLQQAVKEKQTHENDNNLIFIAKNSLAELKSISGELENLNKKIDTLSGLESTLINNLSSKNNEDLKDDNEDLENEKTDSNIVESNQNEEVNLLDPSVSLGPNQDNLCIIS